MFCVIGLVVQTFLVYSDMNPMRQPFNLGGVKIVASSRVSLGDAAQKCCSLGFKAGTKAFGNSIYKISL